MRSAISIVPQSPDLFEGTIRDNIDPMGTSIDADIWVALEQVRLSNIFAALMPLNMIVDPLEGIRGIVAGWTRCHR